MVLISLRFRKVLRLIKLTHFHLSVKGKGSWRSYFRIQIADLRLDIGLKMIIMALLSVYFIKGGLDNPKWWDQGDFYGSSLRPADPEPHWYGIAI
jgi:hypothetical protein